MIIDSPPVMPVTDAAVVADAATAVLFVVGSEVVTLPAAIRALEQLDASNAKFVGALLNGVDLQRNAFFYSPYYRREYAAYYGHEVLLNLGRQQLTESVTVASGATAQLSAAFPATSASPPRGGSRLIHRSS